MVSEAVLPAFAGFLLSLSTLLSAIGDASAIAFTTDGIASAGDPLPALESHKLPIPYLPPLYMHSSALVSTTVTHSILMGLPKSGLSAIQSVLMLLQDLPIFPSV